MDLWDSSPLITGYWSALSCLHKKAIFWQVFAGSHTSFAVRGDVKNIAVNGVLKLFVLLSHHLKLW